MLNSDYIAGTPLQLAAKIGKILCEKSDYVTEDGLKYFTGFEFSIADLDDLEKKMSRKRATCKAREWFWIKPTMLDFDDKDIYLVAKNAETGCGSYIRLQVGMYRKQCEKMVHKLFLDTLKNNDYSLGYGIMIARIPLIKESDTGNKSNNVEKSLILASGQ